MAKIKIAINGMGRIGRTLLRQLYGPQGRGDCALEVVAVNGPGRLESYLHLLQYDSVHGPFSPSPRLGEGGDSFEIENRKIKFYNHTHPSQIPWEQDEVAIVIDSSGKFKDREGLAAHLGGSVKKVIVCAPGKNLDATFVMGVNHRDYDPHQHHILSNASCTTNCLAPVAKILDQKFGILSGLMTTVHAYTSDQKILDNSHKDLRRARAAALSMVPTTTGAARALGEVLPQLEGKLEGLAIRVPTPNVSLVDLSCELSQTPSPEEINRTFEEAARSSHKGIIKCEERPLVSVDFVGLKESACIDMPLTSVVGKQAKVVAWYDNEVGFSNRVLDLAEYIGSR